MKRCLLVDDSRVIRQVSRRIVESLGCVATEAADGREALAECARAMPDVILLDWNMPVMGGLEFLRELRRSDGGDKPKIVFCTTEHDEDHIHDGFEVGADEYLVKPFNQDMLEQSLHRVGIV